MGDVGTSRMINQGVLHVLPSLASINDHVRAAERRFTAPPFHRLQIRRIRFRSNFDHSAFAFARISLATSEMQHPLSTSDSAMILSQVSRAGI